MPISFSSLAALLQHDFDDLIDVRSPSEFAEDHIPGAINLPALSDTERVEVGTTYVQVAPFEARKLGAAKVARNVATYLDGPLKSKSGAWRPLIYCWRGGQRSGSVASIFKQIGWRADTLKGGYRSFRRMVQMSLYESPLVSDVILLDGNTGTGKTDILHRLARRGVQVLDLEDLANHRGSLLGTRLGEQPSQKAWETSLACALASFDGHRPVLIEAESSKIGKLIIPPSLWGAMKVAPRITIKAPINARARFLVETYADLCDDRDLLSAQIEALRRHRGSQVDAWLTLCQKSDFNALASALIKHHYDPSYRTSRKRNPVFKGKKFNTDTLSIPARENLADQITDWLHSTQIARRALR